MSDKIGHIEKAAPAPDNTPNNGGLGGALDSMRESKNKAIKGFINNNTVGLNISHIIIESNFNIDYICAKRIFKPS